MSNQKSINQQTFFDYGKGADMMLNQTLKQALYRAFSDFHSDYYFDYLLSKKQQEKTVYDNT